MTRIITVAERDANALARRRCALRDAERCLAATAIAYNGRYRVFGSVVRGEIRADSDLDVLAEFPDETVNSAISAAQRVCWELGVPCDILDIGLCGDEFLRLVLPESRVAR